MNIVALSGRPTKDPIVEKSEKTGRVYSRFRLAVKGQYRGKNEPNNDDFFTIVCFGKRAEFAMNYLGKGLPCIIVGRLSQSVFVDSKGVRREETSVIATSIDPLEWAKRNRAIKGLDYGNDDELLVPREITDSLFKAMSISSEDEDMPSDLTGGSI